jgi:hypothetical protein
MHQPTRQIEVLVTKRQRQRRFARDPASGHRLVRLPLTRSSKRMSCVQAIFFPALPNGHLMLWQEDPDIDQQVTNDPSVSAAEVQICRYLRSRPGQCRACWTPSAVGHGVAVRWQARRRSQAFPSYGRWRTERNYRTAAPNHGRRLGGSRSERHLSAVSGCQAGCSLTDASPTLEPSICKSRRLGCVPSGAQEGRSRRGALLAHQSGSSPCSRRYVSMFAACSHCPPLEPQNFQRSAAAR